jgi:DNA repair exonuclease SbcCD ATPase subunit
MRIGSFFSVLLVALIALGFFLSDSMHLRESIKSQQQEIQRLTIALQKSEQEKQNALATLQSSEHERQNTLISLQNTSQRLQACQQEVARSGQLVAQLTNENTALKQQIHSLNSASQSVNSVGVSAPQLPQMPQARAASLIAFAVMGVGSVLPLAWKSLQKKPFSKRCNEKKGNYVYLSQEEIKELAKRRRAVNKSSSSHSDG